MADRKPATIEVPTKDPEEDEKKDKELGKDKMQAIQEQEDSKLTNTADEKDKEKDKEMSAEDAKLKETLELYVARLTEPSNTAEVRKTALDGLCHEIRSATSSMTSIPKPLKFLRPHYETIKKFYESKESTPIKVDLADMLSVLAMTMAKEGTRESLHYKLAGKPKELGTWGHEYVRHLAGELGEEYNVRIEEKKPVDDLISIVDDIVPFHMKHNAETDACDLLTEVDRLSKIVPHVNDENANKVCPYLLSCTDYAADQEEKEKTYRVVFEAYCKANILPDALRVALKLNDKNLIRSVFDSSKDPLLTKQLGFILSTQKIYISGLGDQDLLDIVGNAHLSSHFRQLAQELDVQEAKTPDDVYKTQLGEEEGIRKRSSTAAAKVDSAKQNLASTFVNAFVNLGFGKDKLITDPPTPDQSWIYKNKDHGMYSAAASLGMIHLWDLETGLNVAEQYSESKLTQVKAGALLAMGIISSGVTQEYMDAALGFFREHIESTTKDMKLSAVYGLGLAYAGTCREDVLESLIPLVVDSTQPMEIASTACLSLGLVYVGSANEEISQPIIEAFMERTATDLNDSSARMMCVGLALLFLSRGEACEVALAAIQAIEHPISKFLALTVETCAYFGSGNVLQFQKLLSLCGEHLEDDASKNMHQAVAVLGLAMVTMGEDLGGSLALRSFDHILQYGELNVRRAVPFALSLLNISNPRLSVVDTLSKLSHDEDEEVSQNAVLALGFLGAGTNHARIAGLLRQLAVYYAKEPNHLFLVRVAQGLLHMGKGLVTLSPYHSDRFLLNQVAAAGLVAVFHTCLDLKHTILDKKHYLLFSLVCSARPRMLVALDENLKPLQVKVRVGQAVDTVGQAGKPKTITGFQTHTTPVVLGFNDRAELAGDEYIPLTSVLEGVVIMKKNPNATKEE